jgi:hypothetical protein
LMCLLGNAPVRFKVLGATMGAPKVAA